jgi:hypothetical protein
MAKRIASDNLPEKETKKLKADAAPTFQSVIAELFEADPATDSLQEPAKEESIKEVSSVHPYAPRSL